MRKHFATFRMGASSSPSEKLLCVDMDGGITTHIGAKILLNKCPLCMQ